MPGVCNRESTGAPGILPASMRVGSPIIFAVAGRVAATPLLAEQRSPEPGAAGTALWLFITIVGVLAVFLLAVILLTISNRRHSEKKRRREEAAADDAWEIAGRRAQPLDSRPKNPRSPEED